jgi:hypothetical protein
MVDQSIFADLCLITFFEHGGISQQIAEKLLQRITDAYLIRASDAAWNSFKQCTINCLN